MIPYLTIILLPSLTLRDVVVWVAETSELHRVRVRVRVGVRVKVRVRFQGVL